ncbi:MAG: transposase [Acidobacteriota bacterium]
MKIIPYVHFQDVTIRTSGRTPHWALQGALYSITFRLADALPRFVQRRLNDEFIHYKRRFPSARREQVADMRQRTNVRLDHELDRGYGRCSLRGEKVAGCVADALLHFHSRRYHLAAWSVMPNHVHALILPIGDNQISEILHSWKSFTGTEVNRILGRSGPLWQRDYFDRIIRDERDFEQTMTYIVNNAAKAGLRNWKWQGVGWRP